MNGGTFVGLAAEEATGAFLRYGQRRRASCSIHWSEGNCGAFWIIENRIQPTGVSRRGIPRKCNQTAEIGPISVPAAKDFKASIWSGHCDDIPAAADAPTLDELLSKISAMALDLLPDNHPEADPESVFIQITALREAERAAA